jgi:hypothetical protein
VILLGYWSKAKKKVYRRGKHRVRMTTNPIYAGKYRYKKYKKAYRKGKQFNDKYDVVGLTPDHLVSPIDFVPFVNVANKTYRVGKYSYKGYKAVKTSKKVRKSRQKVVRGLKSDYRRRKRVVRRGRKDSSSPNRTKSRSPYYKGRRKRYEYYRRK